MLWIAILLMGAVTVVGYFKSEEARKKRKKRERKEGRKLEEFLTYGSVDVVPDAGNIDQIESELSLRDAINFRLEGPNDDIAAYRGALKLGLVSTQYHKYGLFREVIADGKKIKANCTKKVMSDAPETSLISVTFEVVGGIA